MIHDLKIRPQYFEDILFNNKNFEIRENDRKYCKGDLLILREYDGKKRTRRVVIKEVIYVHYGTGEFGLEKGYCVLGLGNYEKRTKPCWKWDAFRFMFVCSVCGGNPTEGTGHALSFQDLAKHYRYCKDCGAKMEG